MWESGEIYQGDSRRGSRGQIEQRPVARMCSRATFDTNAGSFSLVLIWMEEISSIHIILGCENAKSLILTIYESKLFFSSCAGGCLPDMDGREGGSAQPAEDDDQEDAGHGVQVEQHH